MIDRRRGREREAARVGARAALRGARGPVRHDEAASGTEARVRVRAGLAAATGGTVGRAALDATDPRATETPATDVPGAMTIVRAAVADSATGMRDAFHAPRASERNGVSAVSAFGTRAVLAATTRDVVSAHRRLDRGHRRGHVQWKE
jgi:hypothetical protein